MKSVKSDSGLIGSILDQKRFQTIYAFRVFMAICTVGFVAFGLYNWWAGSGGYYDPLWLRGILSGLCGILLLFSFIDKKSISRWYLPLLYFFFAAVFLWVLAIAILNRFSLPVTMQLLAATFMLNFGFTIPLHLLFFCIHATSFIAIAVWWVAPPGFPSVTFVGLIIVGQVISYIVVSLKQRSDLEMAFAREEAERANRAKDVLLAKVSHDFRTPLTALLGFSQILLSEEKDEERKRMIHMMGRSAEMLLRLVDDVLEFSRVTQHGIVIEQAPFSFREVVDMSLASVRTQAFEKRLVLGATVSDRIPPLIIGDRLRVSQILVNLLTNAVKYTDRGSVSLFADYRTDAGSATPLLIVQVSDTGRGIPASDIDRIFDGFLQLADETGRKRPGLGLGLSIVKNLVERMGGSITVESEPGKGSTFTMSLPLPPFSASA